MRGRPHAHLHASALPTVQALAGRGGEGEAAARAARPSVAESPLGLLRPARRFSSAREGGVRSSVYGAAAVCSARFSGLLEDSFARGEQAGRAVQLQ